MIRMIQSALNVIRNLILGNRESVSKPVILDFFTSIEVVAVACGGFHSLALARVGDDSDVYAWGCNASGQLGLGDREDPTGAS